MLWGWLLVARPFCSMQKVITVQYPRAEAPSRVFILYFNIYLGRPKVSLGYAAASVISNKELLWGLFLQTPALVP